MPLQFLRDSPGAATESFRPLNFFHFFARDTSTMAFCTLGAQQYDLRNGNARDRQVQDLRLALARAFRR